MYVDLLKDITAYRMCSLEAQPLNVKQSRRKEVNGSKGLETNSPGLARWGERDGAGGPASSLSDCNRDGVRQTAGGPGCVFQTISLPERKKKTKNNFCEYFCAFGRWRQFIIIIYYTELDFIQFSL